VHFTSRISALFATIPSPSSGSISIGPLKFNAYGLMIALGVIAAVVITGRRFVRLGIGKKEDVTTIALWAVPAGVVGGRLYHVLTDWSSFDGRRGDMFKVWEGGLGIWGGITVGVLVGLWRVKKLGIAPLMALTAVAPALAVAQAIGRWGNWFNQELFGKPTDLPWALEVSDMKAISAGYPPGTTFHPTFLYESIGCLLLAGLLLLVERRVALKPGRLFAVYVAGYTAMRFFIEGLRIDRSHEIGGLRWNQWVSAVVFAISIAVLITGRVRPSDSAEAAPASTVNQHE
jgi:prolipoprotein diacylglyceryl transferase